MNAMTTEPSPRELRSLAVSKSIVLTLVAVFGCSAAAVVMTDISRELATEASAFAPPAPGLRRAAPPRRVVVVRRSRAS